MGHLPPSFGDRPGVRAHQLTDHPIGDILPRSQSFASQRASPEPAVVVGQRELEGAHGPPGHAHPALLAPLGASRRQDHAAYELRVSMSQQLGYGATHRVAVHQHRPEIELADQGGGIVGAVDQPEGLEAADATTVAAVDRARWPGSPPRAAAATLLSS